MIFTSIFKSRCPFKNIQFWNRKDSIIPCLRNGYHTAPRRPRKDLYEEEEEEGGGEGWRESSQYSSWRDWMYDRKKYFIRAGIIGAGAGAYYWYHLESTPITGRSRFMSMDEEQEERLAEQSLQQLLHQFRHQLLPSSHPAVSYVEQVASKIIGTLDRHQLASKSAKWRIFVIDSPTANAFVLPSGAIFVFTGILPIAGSESGLAAIIGHEIAHKVARHGAEKMSFYQFFSLATTILQIFVTGGEFGSGSLAGLLQNLFLFLPFSRKCEVEADYIGLLLMARACYDPNQAIKVWQRMQETSKEGGNVPAFVSTHPSNADRIEKIQEWIPEAMKEFENAGCTQKQNFFKSSAFW